MAGVLCEGRCLRDNHMMSDYYPKGQARAFPLWHGVGWLSTPNQDEEEDWNLCVQTVWCDCRSLLLGLHSSMKNDMCSLHSIEKWPKMNIEVIKGKTEEGGRWAPQHGLSGKPWMHWLEWQVNPAKVGREWYMTPPWFGWSGRWALHGLAAVFCSCLQWAASSHSLHLCTFHQWAASSYSLHLCTFHQWAASSHSLHLCTFHQWAASSHSLHLCTFHQWAAICHKKAPD